MTANTWLADLCQYERLLLRSKLIPSRVFVLLVLSVALCEHDKVCIFGCLYCVVDLSDIVDSVGIPPN